MMPPLANIVTDSLKRIAAGHELIAENYQERELKFTLYQDSVTGSLHIRKMRNLRPITFSYRSTPPYVFVDLSTLERSSQTALSILCCAEKILSEYAIVNIAKNEDGMEEFAFAPPDAQPDWDDPYWKREIYRFTASLDLEGLKSITIEKVRTSISNAKF
jgi:hypothetical protein